MGFVSKLLSRRERHEKPVKYPCRKCIYFGACGDGARTKPCEDRKTKKDTVQRGSE